MPITFYITIIISLFLLFSKIDKILKLSIVFSIFTGVAFCNVGGNSILAMYVIGAVFLLRWFVLTKRNEKMLHGRGGVSFTLFLFIAYCFISIFTVNFHTNELVTNVTSGIGYAKFSIQQLTQFMYLFYAFLYMIAINNMLENRIIVMDDLWKCIDCMYIIAVSLGFLQLIIPVDIFNYWFANDMIGSVNQRINGIVRIDSTFPEPSMYSLFLTPILSMYIYCFFQKPQGKYVIFILGGMLTGILNSSSTFLIGILVFVSIIIWDGINKLIKNKFKVYISRKKIWWTIAIIGIVIISLVIMFPAVQSIIILLVEKLTKKHQSGVGRYATMYRALDNFRASPVFGIGFGTMRSMDLFSNWLGQLGIVGMTLYGSMLVRIIWKLNRIRSVEAMQLSILIIVSNVILFVSVPEYRFLYVWIYYAMAFYLVKEKMTRMHSIDIGAKKKEGVAINEYHVCNR